MIKNLIDIIDTTNYPKIIENIMADSQQMTPKQMLKCGIENYKKRLKANKGYNFQYWNERHERLLQNGWNLFLIRKSATTQ